MWYSGNILFKKMADSFTYNFKFNVINSRFYIIKLFRIFTLEWTTQINYAQFWNFKMNAATLSTSRSFTYRIPVIQHSYLSQLCSVRFWIPETYSQRVLLMKMLYYCQKTYAHRWNCLSRRHCNRIYHIISWNTCRLQAYRVWSVVGGCFSSTATLSAHRTDYVIPMWAEMCA